MTCYSPLQGWRSRSLSKNGKRPIVFSPKDGFIDMPVSAPCGQCIGCRLERSRQWAVRCVHEAQLHDFNSFITLTYSDEFLPRNLSLNIKHFQDFMKRFRRRVSDVDDRYFVASDFRLRFFHCGEYGSKFGRPHYHALIFGYDFPDKYLWKKSNDQDLYRSSFLEELWPFGHSSVGTATFESAAYVARYLMKKVNGDAALEHYKSVDLDTGEVFDRAPEYTSMSRRPGIGKGWFDLYKDDVFPSDEVIMRGKRFRPPKYYDGLYELYDPEDSERIKIRRKAAASKHDDNNSLIRLDVRRKVKEAQIKRLVRDLD